MRPNVSLDSNKKHIAAGPKLAGEHKLALPWEHLFTWVFSACAGVVNQPWAPGRQPLLCIAGKALCFLCICHRYLKVEKIPTEGEKSMGVSLSHVLTILL